MSAAHERKTAPMPRDSMVALERQSKNRQCALNGGGTAGQCALQRRHANGLAIGACASSTRFYDGGLLLPWPRFRPMVMAALDAAIQKKTQQSQDDMDGRVKPGHDNVGLSFYAFAASIASSSSL